MSEPLHSESASQYVGRRAPVNTMKNNKSSIRAFERFIVGPTIYGEFETEPHLQSVIPNSDELRGDEEVRKLKRKLFDNVPQNQPLQLMFESKFGMILSSLLLITARKEEKLHIFLQKQW